VLVESRCEPQSPGSAASANTRSTSPAADRNLDRPVPALRHCGRPRRSSTPTLARPRRWTRECCRPPSPNLSVAQGARRVHDFGCQASSLRQNRPYVRLPLASFQTSSTRSQQPRRNQPIRPIPSRSSLRRHAANSMTADWQATGPVDRETPRRRSAACGRNVSVAPRDAASVSGLQAI
jgi:hypothetical protein